MQIHRPPSVLIGLSALGALSILSAPPALAVDHFIVRVPAHVSLSAPAAPADPLSVALGATSLPQAILGEAYAFDFTSLLSVTGGAGGGYNLGEVTWSLESGTLPAGLTLNANGTISGTPTEAKTSNFTLKAAYKTASGVQAYQLVSIKIIVSLHGATLPQAVVGQAYDYDVKPLLSVSGDAAFVSGKEAWSLASGTLPAGLTLNANGTISGTPTEAKTSDFTLRAAYKTAFGVQAYQLVSAQIVVTLAASTLPAAMVNTNYSPYDFKSLLSVTGDPAYAVGNVSFSATGLPQGMTLSNSGVLSGKPVTKNAAGASFEVVATYKTATGQQAYTLVVNGVPLEVTQIASGEYHTCALTTSGGAKCWGKDNYGQLGDDTNLVNQPEPVDVYGLSSGVVSIGAGEGHTCALIDSGVVKCWGYNFRGELGDGTTGNKATPVTVKNLLAGVTSLAVGGLHNCALLSDGTAKCWGHDSEGQLGTSANESYASNAVTVEVLAAGSIRQLAAGSRHTCAVTTSGAAYCWGSHENGQLGIGGTMGTSYNKSIPTAVSGMSSGAQSISAGGKTTCAVMTGGALKCWGHDAYGQLGNDSAFADKASPVTVINLGPGVAKVSVGGGHVCAITTAGGLKCWGRDNEGQVGDGTVNTANKPTPVDVPGLNSGVSGVSSSAGSTTATGGHTCAIMTNAKVKCWGRDNEGQLGDDAVLATKHSPVDVQPF